MTVRTKLIIIKTIHTAVWVFFNVVIFYLLYAAITGKIDTWLWICISFILLECIVLAVFKRICPITLVARKYSTSQKNNFDIFLPDWLAKHNKLIYSIIVGISIAILLYRLIA